MSGCHMLNKNHKNQIPSRMVFFDTESYVNTKVTKEEIAQVMAKIPVYKVHDHYLTCACFWNRNKENWIDYYGSDLNKFWYDVDSELPNKCKVYVFAHNAKYDALVSGVVPLLVSIGYCVDGFSEDNPFILKFHKKDGKKIVKTIIVLSSTNYYHDSIESLGKVFGEGKQHIEYSGDDMQKTIEYCRTDVDIMKKAMLFFIFDLVKNEDLGNFAMTIAGQAFAAYRHRFMHEEIFLHREKDALILERDAYAGGRNEAWFIGHYKGRIYYFDVNSMYPYEMKNQLYPVKMISYRKHNTIDDLQRFLNDGYLVCARVRLKTDLPKYFKKDTRLLFPVGEFWTCLSTPELQEALKDGSIQEIADMSIYEGKKIFAEYVEYFYTKRMAAKRDHNEILKLGYKLFLNTLYGKFGEKNTKWDKIGEAKPDDIGLEKVFDADKQQLNTYKVFGGGIFKKGEDIPGECEARNSFPAIAAHVTAYARMLIWKNIEIAGMKNVYYMDTDSIFGNEEAKKNLTAAGVLDDNELGKMKIEAYGEEITIHGCKDYEFPHWEDGKFYPGVKIKGVPKKAIKIGKNKYVCTQWGGMAKYIKIGDLHKYENRLIIKTLRREYDKGKITITGRVKPFCLKVEKS